MVGNQQAIILSIFGIGSYFILSTGISITKSVVTNIGVSTFAINAAIQHLRNKNISFTIL
jgi:hypothetical protein